MRYECIVNHCINITGTYNDKNSTLISCALQGHIVMKMVLYHVRIAQRDTTSHQSIKLNACHVKLVLIVGKL